jgi:hypothetical protein
MLVMKEYYTGTGNFASDYNNRLNTIIPPHEKVKE